MLILISIIAFFLSIPALMLLAEVLSARFVPNRDLGIRRDTDRDVSFKIIIPAHNEEDILENTLIALLAHVACENILVIADNCSDRTAEIARSYNIAVFERENDTLRGKGYALDYGIRCLSEDPPDVVLFLDADCSLERGAFSDLAIMAYDCNLPVQAYNIQRNNNVFDVQGRIGNFAMLIKNYIRPLGLKKLNMPCLLTGTGMAIPWKILRKVHFATGNIVEDLQLGIDFAIVGAGPLFCEKVKVVSSAPHDSRTVTMQRSRWEHGHLDAIVQQMPKLIREAVRQFRLDLFMLALEIGIPPLSFYLTVSVLFVMISLIIGLYFDHFIYSIIASAPVCIVFVALALCWCEYGRQILPLYALARIPQYFLRKIPLYLKFFVDPEKSWRRTKRKSDKGMGGGKL